MLDISRKEATVFADRHVDFEKSVSGAYAKDYMKSFIYIIIKISL